MSNQENLTPAQQELESALAALQPGSSVINRDLLLFRAGRKSVRRHNRLWQTLTGTLAVMLAISLGYRPAPPSITSQFASQKTTPLTLQSSGFEKMTFTPDKSNWDDGSYFKLRKKVLEEGLDVLPRSESSTGSEIIDNPASLLKELLSS
ncbi:MAG: hypothetical protein JW860_05015 [Sedimentisphaerales bacterium]|nr:hypothetical protein [Sedimentisphaerales bacterium]